MRACKSVCSSAIFENEENSYPTNFSKGFYDFKRNQTNTVILNSLKNKLSIYFGILFQEPDLIIFVHDTANLSEELFIYMRKYVGIETVKCSFKDTVKVSKTYRVF